MKKANSVKKVIKKKPEVKKSEVSRSKIGYSSPEVESSYGENDLGKTLYDLVMDLRPVRIVEFGTLNGYSAIAMAQALRDLGAGHIVSYDLWDGYKFKRGTMSLVQDAIEKAGLAEFITLQKADFKHWESSDEDLVFVDISNDGETIRALANKMKNSKAVAFFEGGTVERDTVKWMTRYNRPPIRSSGVRYDVIEERFPSISKLI